MGLNRNRLDKLKQLTGGTYISRESCLQLFGHLLKYTIDKKHWNAKHLNLPKDSFKQYDALHHLKNGFASATRDIMESDSKEERERQNHIGPKTRNHDKERRSKIDTNMAEMVKRLDDLDGATQEDRAAIRIFCEALKQRFV